MRAREKQRSDNGNRGADDYGRTNVFQRRHANPVVRQPIGRTSGK